MFRTNVGSVSSRPSAAMSAREGEACWSLGSLTALETTDENTNGSFSMIETTGTHLH